MNIKVDLKIFVFVLFFFFMNQSVIYLLLLLFAMIHEIGHLVARFNFRTKAAKHKNYANAVFALSLDHVKKNG